MSTGIIGLSINDVKFIQSVLFQECKISKDFCNYFLKNDIIFSSDFESDRRPVYNDNEIADIENKLINRGYVHPDFEWMKESYRKDWFVPKGSKASDMHELRKIGVNINSIYIDEKSNTYVTGEGYPLDDNFMVDSNTLLITKFLGKLESALKEKNGKCVSWDSFHISNFLQYSVDVSYSLLYADDIVSSIEGTSLEIYCPLYRNERFCIDFDELIPNLLFPRYKWSKPKNSGSFGRFLQNIFKERDYDEEIVYIHMEGEDLVYSEFTPEGTLKSYCDGRKSYIKNIENTSVLLMKYLKSLGDSISVKEIYFINNSDSYCGKYIARKNPDGEYTLTFY